MAGMLPGVECARRRRFHQSSERWSDSSSSSPFGHHCSTRRSSFCLYSSSNHEYHHHHHTSTSSLQRNPIRQAYLNEEKLDEAAREAKERLDERLRLRGHTKSESKRASNIQKETRNLEGRSMDEGVVQMEVLRSKKSRSKRRFNWAKLGWRSSEQEDCAVCLEEFKAGENLMHLACAHRFHSKCLVPWLHNNAHCPCCRMEILN